MSDVIKGAVDALSTKLDGGFEDGTAKFVIEGEGTIIIDGDGVRAAGDADAADVTLTAGSDTFEQILEGDLDPTAAFMSGKLSVDGDMGLAMKLGNLIG
jgi:putative sterol carrier protein